MGDATPYVGTGYSIITLHYTRPVVDGLTWEHMLNLGWYGTEVDRGEPHAHRLPAASSVELSLAAGLRV